MDIHLYGYIKKKFVPNAKLGEATVIKMNEIENETFSDLLVRIKVDYKEIGDCFVNGKLAHQNTIIPKNARIGIFSMGMCLLDGGQHIKGHGYVLKSPPNKLNNWN